MKNKSGLGIQQVDHDAITEQPAAASSVRAGMRR
jgi:hypothetical protein